jgi:uncharacterized membrane protein
LVFSLLRKGTFLGFIALYVGVANIRTPLGENRSIWYNNPYIFMSITAFLIALVILADDIRISISHIHTITTIFLLIVEGVLLVCAGISCVFMLRYLFFKRQNNINDC